MAIPIEDNFEDVLAKAATGLGLGKHELAERAELTVDVVSSLLDAHVDEVALRAVAPVLNLDADALVAMADGKWYPEAIELEGLKCYNTPFPVPGYEAMTVNAYLVWHPESKVAVAFDTGASVDVLLTDVDAMGLDLQALVITHTHRDHIAAYERLLDAIDGDVAFAPKLEPIEGADLLEHGDSIEFEGLDIHARQTNGHSPGGMSYVIEGLEKPVAIVGDSLFCLSQGGAQTDYARALQNNREQLLSLADDTILCPGHGPMTTVANEKAHNPFYPEFK
ncbi:MBL fold metallo-hydrolase [Coraliomargarita akajimensis]|uniref:Zn-dependent hydrolase, glyoxylase family n=1 Tax=Coraliomargarita akajimensis (strain DSM 45221 / IAM 15411 / JCM 23193 / KCTC 12865 / 04OKA010-24) TaxID=583355 RepID=D5EN30_CORAD|nr:MBL fold metallo-hydrolase [Coraliomargarita akajimensis]ADE53465.1 Zn-dependent hydrolase, glyoxylase family [Coraliomargarita akajimensis DSM 45221]